METVIGMVWLMYSKSFIRVTRSCSGSLAKTRPLFIIRGNGQYAVVIKYT